MSTTNKMQHFIKLLKSLKHHYLVKLIVISNANKINFMPIASKHQKFNMFYKKIFNKTRLDNFSLKLYKYIILNENHKGFILKQ